MKKNILNILITIIFLFNIMYLFIVQNYFCANIPFWFTTILSVVELYLLYKSIDKLDKNQDVIKTKLEDFSKNKNKYSLNSETNEASMNTLIPWILILCFFMTRIDVAYHSPAFWIAFGVQLMLGVPVFFVYSFIRLIPNKKNEDTNEE